MGNVSRVAILNKTHDVSTLRRSNVFLKAATPALVLSAAVLFSASAHAAESAPVQAGKAAPEMTAFEKRYAPIEAGRQVLKGYREDLKLISVLEREAEQSLAATMKEVKVVEAASDKIGALEKNVRALVKEYKDAHPDNPYGPQISDLEALSEVDYATVKSLGLEGEFGKKADAFLKLVDVKHDELHDKKAALTGFATKDAVWHADLADEKNRIKTDNQYLGLEAADYDTPRGVGSESNPRGGWASGDLANAKGVDSTAFGTGAEAMGNGASAVGHRARANGVGASAFGKNADASGYGSSASGYQASATGVGATATGAYALASGAGATAVGAGSMAVNGGTAIGAYSSAVAGATAIGQGAVADANGAVAIGDAVVNKEANTVAFANGDDAKRLTHVAAGQNDTDAVNVKQIRESAQGVKSALRGEMDASSQRAISQSNGYTDQKVGEIRKEMAALDKSFRRGIASSAALMMSTPYAPGKVAATAGTALYRGTPAIAAGASYWNQGGTWNINGGIATAGSNSTIIRLGGSMLF